MKKKFTKHLIALSVALGSASTYAQLLKYNSKAEIYGAAAVSPSAGAQILEKLVALCSTIDTPTRQASESALKDWKLRHQAYIDENANIRREFLGSLSTSPAPETEKQQVRRMLEISVPKMIEAQYSAISLTIDALESSDAKSKLCMDYMQSVVEGKWDLRKNDPVVAQFLDSSIAARKAGEASPQLPTAESQK